ncbi:unnamed protein product [Closterium sp. NIES-65]|nr:unnamed protein product [Closterium sp. NIES-65]
MSFGSSSLLRGDSSSDALTYHRPPRGGMRKETRQRRVVECKVKRRKEPRLDAVIERNKKFRIVQRIQELLGKQEGGRMSLKELGKHRNKIGLSGGRRCVSLIRRFPSIFRVYDKGAGNIWFELTPEAARRDARERELRAIMEPILVDKLCKLLMMSATQSLSVESVGHVRRELGLPEDFKTSFLPRFSDRFRVATPPAAPPGTPAAAGAGGPVLVLQQWDDRLALSVAEANEAAAMAREEVREEAWEEAQKEGSEAVAGTQLPPPKPSLTPEQLAEAAIGLGRHKAETSRMAYITGKTSAEQEGTSSGVASGAGTAGSSSSSSSSSSREQRYKKAVRLSLKLNLPPGLKLKQSDLLRLQRFHSSPQISPYANPLELGISPESMEAERRAVAVIREFLSLTVEKRCLIDQLTHFRKDFLLPARIYALLLRHPEVFYVSVKGVRDSVFLREAYEGEVLIMSDELADAIEEMRVLMEDGRRRMRRGEVGRGEREGNGRGGSDEESEWESEDEEEWGEEDEEEEEEEEEEEGWEREKGRNSRVVPGVWKRANGQAVGSGGRVKSNAMSVEVGRKGGERGWERGGERGGERGVGRGVGRGETRGVRKGENEGERKWVGVARWGRESGRVDGSRWVPVGSAVGEESEGDKRTGREKERGEEEEKEGRGGDEEEEGEGGEDEERGGKARAAGMRGRGDEVRRERERVGVIGAKEKGRGKESWRSKGIHRQGLIKDRW